MKMKNCDITVLNNGRNIRVNRGATKTPSA